MNNLLSISDFIAVSFFAIELGALIFMHFRFNCEGKGNLAKNVLNLHDSVLSLCTAITRLVFDDWFYCERIEIERTAR